MLAVSIICFIAWIYLLSVLKRSKLNFFYFLVGSVGIFLFTMSWLQPILTVPLTKLVAAATGVLGKLTGMFESYFQYGMLFINRPEGSISMFIDYECSGIIEILAFSSMLWFFPVYNAAEKLVVNLLGILWTFASNIIRILSICTLVFFFGNDVFFFAHTILGRIIFYGLSIALYFFVFTRSQIVRQKVGNLNYENNSSTASE